MKTSSNKLAGLVAGAAAPLAIAALAGCSAGEPVIVEKVRTVEVPSEPIVKEVVRTVEVPVVVEVEKEVVKEVVVEVASTPVTRDVVRTVTVEVPVVVEKVERVEVPVVVEKVVVATPAPAPATRTVTDDARQEAEIPFSSEKANAAADALRAKIAAQREGLPEEGPRAFGIFGTSESFLAFTSSSYLGDMTVKLNGGMATDGAPPYVYRGIPDPACAPFSLEKAVERDPDVVMAVRRGDPGDARETNFASLFSGAAWSGLSAVENGRTSELSEWLYPRCPGPRAAWAMSELRPILYPDDEER